MDTPPTDEKLGKEERILLYFLGGAGLLAWVIAASFLVNGSVVPKDVIVANPLLRQVWAAGGPSLLLPATPTAAPSATPTATATPTSTPTPTLTPTPTQIPSGAPMLPIDGDIQVIALLGIDEERDATLWRTDSIILAFVDRKQRRLSLLSLPRDLWVRIPGYQSNRINTVDCLGERTKYPGGGPALLDQTLRLNLGVPMHHYVRIDFAGFVRMIDALGGITVDVKHPLTDRFPDPDDPTKRVRRTLPVGPAYMDGQMALTYSRSRITTNDFDRSARQQQVLFAVWRKALSLDAIKHAPQLWQEFSGSFETDLSVTEVLGLVYFAQGIDLDEVRSAQVDGKQTRSWTTPGGAQVLLPDTALIQKRIAELLLLE
ncbi:MAG: LCP family protein [Anaerolineae bacterium]|nr:LCP family protein [Anaerolineae bacterium]